MMFIKMLLVILLLIVIGYLLAGGILWFNNRYRIVRIEKKEDVRARISDDIASDREPESLESLLAMLDGKKEPASTAKAEMQQLPNIFSKRIQNR